MVYLLTLAIEGWGEQYGMKDCFLKQGAEYKVCTHLENP